MSVKHPFFAKSPHIMGIVNVTPDSFSDGGRYLHVDQAIEHGLRLVREGADSLDIGGESTRPGALPVSVDEELERVLPVIRGLKGCGVPLSIDTRNAVVMEAALLEGVDILNDVSGFTHDPRSVAVLAQAQVPAIVMHMRDSPCRMQDNPNYNNVLGDIAEFFEGRISAFRLHRIETNLLVFDPGIGFGKNDEHNLLILRNIKKFSALGCALMLGTSRKSFIARLSVDEAVDNRIGGSLASVLWGLSQGVQFFRVHDVLETRQAFTIWEKIQATPSSDALSE
jgi:dihydropteroate synthase